MNKCFLVTGGSGFIGSNFIRNLLSKFDLDIVINLDNLSLNSNINNLRDITSEKYIFYKGDINDRNLVLDILSKHKVDTIVHFAAESHVDRSILDPLKFFSTNILGTQNLLECFKNYLENKNENIYNFRFIHVSTDEVYGSLKKDSPAFTEKTQYKPNSPYAASKASSDHIVRSYFKTYNLPINITNCSNNYGPYQFPEKLIPLVINNCLNNQPIPIYGNGEQIRDWIHVQDHCDALLKIIETKSIGKKFNIGGNSEFSNLEIVKNICKIMDFHFPNTNSNSYNNLIKFVNDRPGHDFRYALNIDKIYNELQWKPKIKLKEGLESTIKWYLDNRQWIKSATQNKDYKFWIDKNYKHRGILKQER